MENEQTIIILAKSGDIQAFESLVKAYSHRLYAAAFRLLGNKEYAEDCIQEVFIKVHRKINSFNQQSKFSTWLYSITVNTAIDLQRKHAKHNKNVSENFDEIVGERSPGPEKSAWIDAIGMTTQRALMQLNGDLRLAFILRHHEERSIEEISTMLELNPNTVKGRIFRAVARLREILEPEVENYEAVE